RPAWFPLPRRRPCRSWPAIARRARSSASSGPSFGRTARQQLEGNRLFGNLLAQLRKRQSAVADRLLGGSGRRERKIAPLGGTRRCRAISFERRHLPLKLVALAARDFEGGNGRIDFGASLEQAGIIFRPQLRPRCGGDG